MKCPCCNGSGRIFYSRIEKYGTCYCCNGTGVVSKVKRECPICQGRGNTGEIPSGYGNTQFERCRYCDGTGIIIETD